MSPRGSVRRASRSRPAANRRHRTSASTSSSATPGSARRSRPRSRAVACGSRRSTARPGRSTPSWVMQHVALIRSTIRLAAELGVRKIVTMSGSPGDGPGSSTVNFMWYPWPADAMALLDRQWTAAIDLWQSPRRRRLGRRHRPARVRAPPAPSRVQRADARADARLRSARSSGPTSIRPTCSGSRWTRWPSSGRSDRPSTTST